MNPKEKLDSLLGITDGKSINDYLDDISGDQDKLKETAEKIDTTVKEKLADVDTSIEKFKTSGTSGLDIVQLESNFSEISELIGISKQVIMHLYDNIVNTSLIDPEIINAAATFIEIAHRNIKEYIDLYKDRIHFFDKIRLEMISQQNKKELTELKHKLAMEKIAAINKGKESGAQPEGMFLYKQENIVDMLAEIDEKNNPKTSYFTEVDNVLAAPPDEKEKVAVSETIE